MKTLRDAQQIDSRYDLVVIGAGPAGMAAGAAGAGMGLHTLVVDENPAPGGQIYRSIASPPLRERTVLGADYWRGESVLREFSDSEAHYAAQASVWSVRGARIDGACEVCVSLRGTTRVLQAGHIILATGALERPFPILGWTLPGVLTAGAAQTALKSAGMVPSGRVVIAGCGPLLLLLAAQLRRAGAQVAGLIDTTPGGSWLRALPAAPEFLRSRYTLKGLRLLREATRGLKVFKGVTDLRVQGGARLESVVVRLRSGSEVRLPADTLLLHQGVVPNINLSSAAGCRHHWDEMQLALVPRLDEWLASDVRGISIAGDGGGIGGAESAALRGRLAALGATMQLGAKSLADCERLAAPVRAELRRALRGRRFLDLLYRPARAFRVPAHAEAIVCRCEEITAGRLREAIALGVSGPNQLKSFLRCGMGPCQGRMCGLTVMEMIAEARGVPPDAVGYYRLRPPVKPVTVAEMASHPHTPEAVRAVEREL